MAKYYGKIGFNTIKKTDVDIYEESITERPYYGDMVRNIRRLESSSETKNDNINIGNSLSIVADPYAYENFHEMRYAIYMGTKWKITSVEVQYPRLILSLGGIYNA